MILDDVKCKKIPDGDVGVPLSSIMSILGVLSKTTIKNFIDKGMPFVENGRQKAYPVKACIFWAVKEAILKIPLVLEDDFNPEDLPPNVRKDLADAKLKELKYDVEKDKYIMKNLVVKKASEAGIIFREGIISLGDRLAGQVASENNQRECKNIIDKETRRLAEQIHAQLSF